MNEQFSSMNPRNAISPAASANNTPIVGNIIDTQGFASIVYVISAGALYGGSSFAVLLEQGDDSGLSDNTTVTTGLLGTAALAGFVAAAANKSTKAGAICSKRYSRLTITPSANGATSYLSAVALLTRPNMAPTPNPPT